MSSNAAPLTLPEQFGPYRIVRPLGQGGMGAVYLARDARLDRDVALKVCHLADNPQALERFRREAKAAASLAHTNLCPVHEFDVRDGIAYLTMGYIEGPTLNAWVAQRGGLSQREAALLVAKLALAMQAAHDGGVVHRDLKPANIIINKKGEPVILDFGLARQMDDPGARLTQLGAIYGTPAYMAPEQAGGDPATVGPAADVYALGVMLYELLTGEIPFAGAPMIMIYNHVNTPPVPPRERNPAVAATLETICLKALAKEPQDRPSSMKELARALAKAARALSATSREPVPRPQPAAAPTQMGQVAVETMPPPLPPLVAPVARNRDRGTTIKVPSPAVRKRRPRKLGGETRVALAIILVLLGVVAAGWFGYHTWQERRKKDAEQVRVAEEDNSRQKQRDVEKRLKDEADQRREMEIATEKKRLAEGPRKNVGRRKKLEGVSHHHSA